MAERPGFIRLAPEPRIAPLSIGDARDAAKGAYALAREAQRDLVANLGLIRLLYRPGKVSFARLKGELAEARRQAERAQAVVQQLELAVESMQAASTKGDES